MLHNTGPYGPNEPPINMGAPLNMSQVTGPMNIAHNFNNLGKNPQQPAQTSSGHYNMPDYSTYGHPPLSMASQMSPFHTYQPMGYQTNFMAQNTEPNPDNNWHNGMLPMNLNMHTDQNTNMMNYHHNYDKRQETVVVDDYKESPVFRRSAHLNIPQIQTKAFHKHGASNDYNNMYGSFKYTDHNLDLSMKTQEKPPMDNTRRKSLENTVKLIENILINSTNKSKNMQTIQETDNTDSQSDSELTDSLPLNCDPRVSRDVEEENINNITEDKQSDEKSVKGSENETSEDEDVKPTDLIVDLVELNVTKDEKTVVPKVEIKVEPMSWIDMDYQIPFHRDVNGVTREDTPNCKIIDSENSVSEATEVMKNGSNSIAYFECAHCCLLFNNPKRFLIHTKWHTFGLTNDKRVETARERELRRTERREARVLERMNATEVTDMKCEGKVFPCKDCEKVFSAKGSLKNHRQRFHPTRVRECKICHKSVLGWMALRTHIATHTGENSSGYQCSDCPKRFKYPHSLAKHRDTHLEKTHGCEQCPKKFGSQALLKMHMKTHERALRGATFRCTYCGKGFFESYNLQVHERTHRNERPFNCDICNTSFGTNSSLKRHLKVSHSTSKPYECSTCHRCFLTEPIRDRHEVRVHGDPEDLKFTCKQCPCRYLKLKDLQKHIYKVHPKGKRKKKEEKSDSE